LRTLPPLDYLSRASRLSLYFSARCKFFSSARSSFIIPPEIVPSRDLLFSSVAARFSQAFCSPSAYLIRLPDRFLLFLLLIALSPIRRPFYCFMSILFSSVTQRSRPWSIPSPAPTQAVYVQIRFLVLPFSPPRAVNRSCVFFVSLIFILFERMSFQHFPKLQNNRKLSKLARSLSLSFFSSCCFSLSFPRNRSFSLLWVFAPFMSPGSGKILLPSAFEGTYTSTLSAFIPLPTERSALLPLLFSVVVSPGFLRLFTSSIRVF